MKNPMDGEVNSKNIFGACLNLSPIITHKFAPLNPERISVNGNTVTLCVKNGDKTDEIILNLTTETAEQLFTGLARSGLLEPDFQEGVMAVVMDKNQPTSDRGEKAIAILKYLLAYGGWYMGAIEGDRMRQDFEMLEEKALSLMTDEEKAEINKYNHYSTAKWKEIDAQIKDI